MTTKLDWSKPIQTRDGRKAVLLENCFETVFSVAIKSHCGGWGTICNYQADGFYTRNKNEGSNDIVNVPEEITQTFWLNIYKDGVYAYLNKSSAKNNSATNTRIACVEVTVTYKIGEGL